MSVVYGLPRCLSYIDAYVIGRRDMMPLYEFFDARQERKKIKLFGCGHVEKRCHMAAGHDKTVAFIYRKTIEKGEG